MYSSIFYLITFCQLALSLPTESSLVAGENNVLDGGYIYYRGIGAIKHHHTDLDWNSARTICINEGAHLAVINSALEESIIARYQIQNNIESSWIGYHDQFKKDDWTTVADQKLDAVGYVHWRDNEPNNNGGNERCVTFEKTGMCDLTCDQKRKFICKINV